MHRKHNSKVWVEDNVIKIKPSNNENIFITDFNEEIYELIRYLPFQDVSGYIRCPIEGKQKRFHHILLPKKDGYLVDHINRNTLDNRRCNLRYLTHSQSGINRGMHGLNTSGYTGVEFYKQSGKWRAKIRVNGKRINLGQLFESAEEAYAVYLEAENRYYPGIRYGA